jgi:TolA-binding protein
LRREDTAGDALWGLAEQLQKEGNVEGRRRTLRYLVEKYPSHRFAQAAREELNSNH